MHVAVLLNLDLTEEDVDEIETLLGALESLDLLDAKLQLFCDHLVEAVIDNIFKIDSTLNIQSGEHRARRYTFRAHCYQPRKRSGDIGMCC